MFNFKIHSQLYLTGKLAKFIASLLALLHAATKSKYRKG
jgi:hypothetical protein